MVETCRHVPTLFWSLDNLRTSTSITYLMLSSNATVKIWNSYFPKRKYINQSDQRNEKFSHRIIYQIKQSWCIRAPTLFLMITFSKWKIDTLIAFERFKLSSIQTAIFPTWIFSGFFDESIELYIKSVKLLKNSYH